jgi:hypothetical protein
VLAPHANPLMFLLRYRGASWHYELYAVQRYGLAADFIEI